MDAQTFDRFTAAMAHRPSRRATLRLLAGGLLAGLLSQRGVAPIAAQDGRPDRDGDGVGDGEEVYNRDNGLGVSSDPLKPEGGAAPVTAPAGCAAGLTDCGGLCVEFFNDRNH